MSTCTKRNLHWHCQRISILNNCKWVPIYTWTNLHTRWCWTKRNHQTNHKKGNFSLMDYPKSIVMLTNWYQYFRCALPLIQQIRWVNLHVLMIALILRKEYAMDLMEPVHACLDLKETTVQVKMISESNCSFFFQSRIHSKSINRPQPLTESGWSDNP